MPGNIRQQENTAKRMGFDTPDQVRDARLGAPLADYMIGLEELGRVRLRVVEERGEREVWNEYVSRYHYLGYKPPAGCRLRYFVESERGRVGCVLLGGAARAIARRIR